MNKQNTFNYLKDAGLVKGTFDDPVGGVVPPPGNLYFVDSGHDNAADTADSGISWDQPFATLDYAVGRCTANQGDVILLAPGHNEDLTGTNTIAVDVAGINIVGLGDGSLKPRFDYNHATSVILVSAANVTIKNIALRPSVATIAKGIYISADYVTLVDVEILPGEAGDGTDEFINGIQIFKEKNYITIDGLKYRVHASADGVDYGINIDSNAALGSTSTGIVIRNCDIKGDFGEACIGGSSTKLTLANCLIENNILISDTAGEPALQVKNDSTGVIRDNDIFADLATLIGSLTDITALYLYRNYVNDSAGTTGTIAGTAAADG